MSHTPPQQTSSAALEAYLACRSRRTSAELDWGPLVVRDRVEPPVKDYLFLPATPDPWLVLVIGGARQIEVLDGSRWRRGYSRPGHVAITSPGRVTEVRWRSQAAARMETLHICLDAAMLRRFAIETADCDPARVEVVDALAESDPLIEQVGLALAHELSSPTPAGRLFADTAAQLLTAHLLRRHCVFPMHADSRGVVLRPYHLRRIHEYIDAHLATSITLDELAGVAGLSPYYFARVFKRTTNETPHGFVMRLKVERAERLLCETDWPVARVARASGFVSASHFAAAFRRRKGTTPGEFRAGRSPRVMSIRRGGSIDVTDRLRSE